METMDEIASYLSPSSEDDSTAPPAGTGNVKQAADDDDDNPSNPEGQSSEEEDDDSSSDTSAKKRNEVGAPARIQRKCQPEQSSATIAAGKGLNGFRHVQRHE